MNNLRKKLKARYSGKRGMKNLAITIVILVEIFALCIVGTFAWVETVSSIKITNTEGTTGTINTYHFTEAMIGSSTATIDLADYFRASGDMHFAPASSAYGDVLYFPKLTSGTTYAINANSFRKSNSSDKNTAFLSVTFKLRADTNADFFFEQVPTFSSHSGDMRVSVTAYPEGMTSGDLYDTTGKPMYTNVYGMSNSTANVINSTDSGTTKATNVMAFADHIKGKGTRNRLFAVGANETKIVTINIWLQLPALTGNIIPNTDFPADVTIGNLGITSSLTPRHVTLLPTPTWDTSGTTEYFYAWCWMDDENKREQNPSRLYGPLTLDADNEHYSFDYNGTFDRTLFLRSGMRNLTKDYLEEGHWNDNTVWNVTEDTSIPNDPVDPTFIIETINGSTLTGDDKYDPSNKDNISDWDTNPSGRPKKSTGSWHDPATVKVAYVTDQNSDWGTLTATSYVGTTTTSHVIESTNSSSQKHKDTIHAWPGKKIQLKAAAKTGYRFVGWYSNLDGTGTALSSNETYTTDAPSTASEITYYAKFVETRTFTIIRTVDDSETSAVAAGTITINGSTTANTATSKTVTVDKGSEVTFSANAVSGYTFAGFYTSKTGGTQVTSPLSALNTNTTYYARFTINSYNVTAHSRYLSGSSYTTSDSTTGGTVQVGSATAGASSTASVKYKASVTLKATPASGYEFVGWWDDAGASANLVSGSATYSYTLSTVGAKNVYARFRVNTFTVTASPYYSTNNGSSYNSGTTGGSVSPASKTLTVGSSVSFTATAANGYEFVGWYSSASGGTQLSTNATYSYKLESYSNVTVYARFIKQSWNLDYGVSGADSWNSTPMTVSGNNVTGTLTLTEGQEFSFQIVKTVGSTNTWYGGGGSYSNITSTSFISNKTLSVDGGDIYMKGHAGTYTFTFNKSTNVLNVTVSYSNITFTLTDVSNNQWLDDGSAIFWFDANGSGIQMTAGGTNSSNQHYWTVSFKSNTRTGSITIKRNNPGNTETWNEFTWTRGYGTSYDAS